MTVPDWVVDPTLSVFEQRKLELAYCLRLAALHHNKSGSVKKLSQAAGFSGDYLALAIMRGHLKVKAALAIRHLVGNDAFPPRPNLIP